MELTCPLEEGPGVLKYFEGQVRVCGGGETIMSGGVACGGSGGEDSAIRGVLGCLVV